MKYIDWLRKDYANAVKEWRNRYYELTNDEWVEGINLQMSYGGKKQWDREADIYEVEILNEIEDYENKSMSILDAGCGYGYLLYKFYKLGFVNLYGIDLSEICVDISNKRFKENDIKTMITHGDLSNTEYVNDRFDIITCTEVLEHDKKPLAIINEIHRILKPGGIAYFSVPYMDRRQAWSHINYFWLENLIDKLPDEDLSQYNVIDIYELFRQSDFKSYFGRLIGNDKFVFIEAEK